MVKHNNAVPRNHFRKKWGRFVKTWFDQPAKKNIRRTKRLDKASKLAPRPLDKLRPIVRCPTIKYNMRIRAGRGFTLDELKAAGIPRLEAQGIGITVDHRRKNRSEEAFKINVDRLKEYRGKLVIFPRNPTSKKNKKGDSSKELRNKAIQVVTKHVLPIEIRKKPQKSGKLTVKKE